MSVAATGANVMGDVIRQAIMNQRKHDGATNPGGHDRKRSRVVASRILFPLAATFAAIALPLGLTLPAAFPSLAPPLGHGHELLFGFVLAVVAGFLATRITPAFVWILVITWGMARCAAAFGSLAPIAGLAFPVAVVMATIPPLMAGAKRPQNRIVPVIVLALLAVDCAWWASVPVDGFWPQQRALLLTVDLFTFLILIVGGRALQSAIGGHLERQDIKRRDPVRRGYELPLAGVGGVMLISDALAWAPVAGACAFVAAALTLHRVLPWQLHYTLGHPRLWTLALGYLWLIPGFVLKGAAQFGIGVPIAGMLHAITIGAIGTTTLVMMARTAMLRARIPLEDFRDIGVAAALLSVAACCRLLAVLPASAGTNLIGVAAGCWSMAFAILLIRLTRVAWVEHTRRVTERRGPGD